MCTTTEQSNMYLSHYSQCAYSLFQVKSCFSNCCPTCWHGAASGGLWHPSELAIDTVKLVANHLPTLSTWLFHLECTLVCKSDALLSDARQAFSLGAAPVVPVGRSACVLMISLLSGTRYLCSYGRLCAGIGFQRVQTKNTLTFWAALWRAFVLWV